MVCCNYKEHTANTVTYYYGNRESDITGIVVFYLDDGSFEILKEPDDGVVYPRSIRKLIGKYWEAFSRKEFGEKISFES